MPTLPNQSLSLFDVIAFAQAGVTVPPTLPVQNEQAALVVSETQATIDLPRPLRTLAATWKARAQDNLVAIRLAKQILDEQRSPSPAETQALRKYVGFGATELAQSLFPVGNNPVRAGWEDLAAELRAIIEPGALRMLARSTQYAHYTPDFMTRAIWDTVVRLGFSGGNVIEPGCGVGLFISAAPDLPIKWIGVENDPTTALVARALHPSARIVEDDFREIKIRSQADLIIGNPPFSQTAVKGSSPAGKLGLRLHDFFIARSLELLRPGGLAAFVTSAGTMDKASQKAREYIGSLAELVGAVRLPQAAMLEQAGTEVVVDVLFLRRLKDSQPGNIASWIDQVDVTPAVANPESTMSVNRWFAERPEMVLGEHAWVTSPFGLKYSCKAVDAKSIEPRFVAALAIVTGNRLEAEPIVPQPLIVVAKSVAELAPVEPTPAIAAAPHLTLLEPLPPTRAKIKGTTPLSDAERAIDAQAYTLKEGSYCIDQSGKLAQYVDGWTEPVAVKTGRGTQGIFAKAEKVIRAFIDVRNALRAVIVAQSEDKPYEAAQYRLTKAYDAFTGTFGPINHKTSTAKVDPITGIEKITDRRPNLAPVLDDPDCWLVASIENYDEEHDTAQYGPIFTERVVRPFTAPIIETTDDALAATLDELGRVDVDYIASILKLTREETIAQLDQRIYSVPNTDEWQTADEYLSGAVRKKLIVAREAAEIDPRYARNVEALEAAQPADLNPSDVTARLGAPWISTTVIEQFVKDVMDIETTVKHEPRIASWTVNLSDFWGPKCKSEWGTSRRHAGELLQDALSAVIPQIFDTEIIGDSEKRVLNPKETEIAGEKLRKIKDAFSNWIWQDADRATTLMRIYNDTYNDIMPRSFNGSHLRLRNSAANITLNPHQQRAAWRIITAGNTYIAHSVGAGKSYSIAAAVMEQRRLGLITKPLITVPGHCLAQFSREWLQLYPTANILVADESNFAKEKRDRFIARATTGNWDCIIITHSAFKFIPSPVAFERALITEHVDNLTTMLDGENDKRTRKNIEQRKESLEARFKALRGAKDDMVTIAEMGIDQIIVDEAQNFRKLTFVTNTRNIKGIDPDGSQRSWDLYVKSQFVKTRRPNRHLMLASGTPVTNTLAELFTIQRYLDEEALRDKQINEFDAWSAMFGETITELELQPSGTYKPVTRYAQFVNVPELVSMFRSFADVIQRKDLRDLIKLPQISTGARQILTGEATRGFKDYQKYLGQRILEIEQRSGKPKPGDDIILSVITDGRHAALDLRLVDRNAENEETNKLNLCIDNVFRIWQETSNRQYHEKDGSLSSTPGAVQMIFSDIGTVSVGKTRGFSAYEWIRDRLIAKGVPAREIAFMQDYKLTSQKQALFNELNSGKKRILIGSSETMGTGVNAQRRLKALHHLDVPWLPSQVEQREGRIERQGNQNHEIDIYAYATPGSMDAPMWQCLQRKSLFIGMAMSGDRSIRRMEDAGAQANSFAIAKAIASGNPLLMNKAGLDAEIARLKRLRSAHLDDQYLMNNSLLNARDRLAYAEEAIAHIEQNCKSIIDTSGDLFRMLVFDVPVTDRNDAGAYLESKVTRLPENPNGAVIGQLGGFDIIGRKRRDFMANTDLYEYGVAFSHKPVWVGAIGEVQGRGMVARLEREITRLHDHAADEQMLIDRAKTTIAEAQARIGIPFEHEAELQAKLVELASIEAQLIEESRIAEEEAQNELKARKKSESERAQQAIITAPSHQPNTDEQTATCEDDAAA